MDGHYRYSLRLFGVVASGKRKKICQGLYNKYFTNDDYSYKGWMDINKIEKESLS
jgi:hypothetical protein